MKTSAKHYGLVVGP